MRGRGGGLRPTGMPPPPRKHRLGELGDSCWRHHRSRRHRPPGASRFQPPASRSRRAVFRPVRVSGCTLAAYVRPAPCCTSSSCWSLIRLAARHSRLRFLPLPLFRPPSALVGSDPATLQAWRGRFIFRDRRHRHKLSECMTPGTDRVDACGLVGLHHPSFPVTDSTSAPNEDSAGPGFTSRRPLLILPLSCAPRIAKHDDLGPG